MIQKDSSTFTTSTSLSYSSQFGIQLNERFPGQQPKKRTCSIVLGAPMLHGH